MMQQHEVLKQVFFLIVQSTLFPDADVKELALDLLKLHGDGYLYISLDENEDVTYVMCGYRVKEAPEKYPKYYPEKEEGDVFYVAWAVSKDNDVNSIKRLLTSFTEQRPDIKTVAFHDRSDGESLKVFNRKIKKSKKKPKANKPKIEKTKNNKINVII